MIENSLIEKYIQLAIDNWYKSYLTLNVDMFKIGWVFFTDRIHGLFMEWEFIRAVARWLEKTKDDFWALVIQWSDMTEHYHFDHWNAHLYHWDDKENMRVLVDDITRGQAFAIRDGETHEFIKNIFKNLDK